VENTTNFLKAWHEYQGSRKRNERLEKKTHQCQTAACLAKRATSIVTPQPCALDETVIGILLIY